MAIMTIEDFLRENWDTFKEENFSQVSINKVERACLIYRSIINLYKRKGLDIHSDSDIHLFLGKDMTAKKFHQALNHANIIDTLKNCHEAFFHAENMIPHDSIRYQFIDYILSKRLPELEESIKRYGVSENLSPYYQEQIKVIFTLRDNGTLEKEKIKVAANAAKHLCEESFINQHLWEINQKQNRTHLEDAISKMEKALKALTEAGDSFQAQKLRIRVNHFFEPVEKIREFFFSKENTEKTLKELCFALLKNDFEEIKKHQNNGQFILDKSGNGSGSLFLPLQDMLDKMREWNIDITDPATYIEIGTTKEDFKHRLHAERQSAEKHPEMKKYLKLKLYF